MFWLAWQTVSPEVLQHLQAGAEAEKQRHFDVAIAEFKKATELAPTRAEAFASLGQAYMENQDYGAAIAPLKHALTLSPDLAAAHQLLGYALLAQGYNAESIAHLEKAQERAALGIAQIGTGQLPQAVENLQAALVQHPNDPDLLYYLGRASGLLSKQAIDTLQAAYPGSARAHQALAENYYVLRQMPQAEKESPGHGPVAAGQSQRSQNRIATRRSLAAGNAGDPVLSGQGRGASRRLGGRRKGVDKIAYHREGFKPGRANPLRPGRSLSQTGEDGGRGTRNAGVPEVTESRGSTR